MRRPPCYLGGNSFGERSGTVLSQIIPALTNQFVAEIEEVYVGRMRRVQAVQSVELFFRMASVRRLWKQTAKGQNEDH